VRRAVVRFSGGPPITLCGISTVSIVAPLFLIILGAIAIGWFVIAFTGHGARRIVCSIVGVLFVLLTVAAVVNAHYEYKATLGSLWGDVGANVVSSGSLEKSTHTTGTVAPGQTTTTAPPGCDKIPDTGEVAGPIDVPGTKSGVGVRNVWVYLPPAWCTNDNTMYPVVIYLHGTPSPEGSKDFLGAMELVKNVDAFAAAHNGKAPVIVMPNVGAPNDTECADSAKYGNNETYVSEDVAGWIENWDVLTGRVQPPGKGWAVGGYSMGGTCGLMLTLRHPDVWHTFADYGGDAFGTGDGLSPDQQRSQTIRDLFNGNAQQFDERDPTKVMAGKKLSDLGGWFGVGGNDRGTMADQRRYFDEATQAGMSVCFDVIPDQDHTFIAWKPTFVNSLPWIAARTGLIPMTPDIQATCKKP